MLLIETISLALAGGQHAAQFGCILVDDENW